MWFFLDSCVTIKVEEFTVIFERQKGSEGGQPVADYLFTQMIIFKLKLWRISKTEFSTSDRRKTVNYVHTLYITYKV